MLNFFKTLPFLSRRALTFTHGTAFEIEVVSYGETTEKIEITGITRDATITLVHANDGTGVKNTEVFRIPDIPIFLSVHTESASILPGELYAQVFLRANGEKLHLLISGYISTDAGLAWPGGKHEGPLDGGGLIKLVTGTTPAAGANWSETVPNEELWLVNSIRTQFTTDATVATRNVTLRVSLGVSKILDLAPIESQTASQIRSYTWMPAPGDVDPSVSTFKINTLPLQFYALPTTVISVDTSQLKAGDQWAAPTLIVKKWVRP